MNMETILVTGADLAPPALKLLSNFELIFAGKAPTEDDVIALCKRHNPIGVIVRYGKFARAAMEAAPALRVISRHGAGVDVIDLDAARALGIDVRAAVGVNAAAVAEHAAALLLASAKSTVKLDERMREGHWDKSTHKSQELGGKTVGLVGLGAIGRRFARIADAMDMKVIGFDPGARDLPDYVEKVSLGDIWTRSDVISLHCPLTDSNRMMINADVLAKCKRGVMLVNTARGGLVDEDALLDALRSGQVFAAGLDSFAQEPLAADHPFLKEANVVLSPHVGGVSVETYVNLGLTAANNLLSMLATARQQFQSSIPQTKRRTKGSS
ncbi:hydroxyacid dehydrogenase [Variovorax defluvii]|uniref:Hydroxyacid dehydrogenase n=1 Tax=Variovorax defluvii TaxID=913761 RepID=A0ABP8HDP7_9BURK